MAKPDSAKTLTKDYGIVNSYKSGEYFYNKPILKTKSKREHRTTAVIPENVIEAIRSNVGYQKMDQSPDVLRHKISDKHIDYIDKCAQKWDIPFDRAYLRCINSGLDMLIDMNKLAQTYENIGDRDVPE